MEHRAECDRLKKEKHVSAAIESLAYEMRLSNETKKAFTELLTTKMMLENDLNIRPGPRPLQPRIYEHYVMYYFASKVSKSKLEKILTKAQLQKWRSAIRSAKELVQRAQRQNEQNGDDDDDAEAVGGD